eukprot:SAG22_NODE_1444_length_4412_cov_2.784605_5_plen_64_part_00
MQTAAEKLLVALRFGNGKYDQGDKIKALANDLKALQMVEELKKPRGIGKSRLLLFDRRAFLAT